MTDLRRRLQRLRQPSTVRAQRGPTKDQVTAIAARRALREAANLAYPEADRPGMVEVALSTLVYQLSTRNDIALTVRIGWVHCRRLIDDVIAVFPTDPQVPGLSGPALRAGLVHEVVSGYRGPIGPDAYAAGLAAAEFAELLAAVGEDGARARVKVLAALRT